MKFRLPALTDDDEAALGHAIGQADPALTGTTLSDLAELRDPDHPDTAELSASEWQAAMNEVARDLDDAAAHMQQIAEACRELAHEAHEDDDGGAESDG